MNNKEIDIFLENKNINFPFLLIWKNDDFEYKFKELNINKWCSIFFKKYVDKFIKIIKKYLTSKIYIRINGKTVLSIDKPLIIHNINKFILILRQKALQYGIGELFIIFPIIEKFEDFSLLKNFDGAYDLSKINLFQLNKNIYNISYYSGIIYKNICFKNINSNFPIYRVSILEINSNDTKINSLKDYSPEKYFILNKIIVEWTKNNYNEKNRFIFINSWNNFKEGNYLEPDDKYGYASINSFSKALFNISYRRNNYNLLNLKENCKIAVQAHIYYDDLISLIINKINNIPVKFDLYITTITYEKKVIIEKYVKQNLKSNKYEIKIVENKGRDILPLIIQLKNKINILEFSLFL